jgi:SAM-dependent methyltransferase
MPKPAAQVTAAEISRLAGVTRATVSNWRRRHPDFPAPTGGTDTSPLYDLPSVLTWLESRGHRSSASSADELRSELRTPSEGSPTRWFALTLAVARGMKREALTDLAALPPAELATRASRTVSEVTKSLPVTERISYRAPDANLLRAVLRCVRDEGPRVALDVLAERALEDATAPGTYPTPEPLADLMARLAAPVRGPYPTTVLDPACGSGTLLVAAARLGATRLHGQDVVPVQALRTEFRLRLDADEAEVTVRAGDSLREDAFPDLTAEAVLCQPPYGDRDWGHDELAYDSRWEYGLPARTESELAWAQHVLSHLSPGGKAVLLLPPATASRASGRRVRTELLRGGAVRAVIALPPGIAQPPHIGLHLWILQRPEQRGVDGRHRVLFVDTVDEPDGSPRLASLSRSGGGQLLRFMEGLADDVLSAWHVFDRDPAGFTDQPGTARAVPVLDLLDDLTDLAPARHVRTAPPTADPAALATEVDALRARLGRSVTALADAVPHGGWQPADGTARPWRTATVADLTRGGALMLYRATRGPSDVTSETPATGGRVLTQHDIRSGSRASLRAEGQQPARAVSVEEGDVLLPATPGPQGVPARVADSEDAGVFLGADVLLFRPDPNRLDPWFLAGFLAAEDNISGASTGAVSTQIDPRRLRLPLMPFAQQRRYGAAFRRLYELRAAAARAAALADETAGLLTTGLTSGALRLAADDSD